MGEFAVALIVPALVLTGVNLAKAVVAKQWETVGWIVGGWVIGFASLGLAASTRWGDQIKLGDATISSLSLPDLVVGGLFAGALAALGFDFLRAVTNIGQNQLTNAEREAQDSAMRAAIASHGDTTPADPGA